jgi:hypothetical protein
VELAIDAEGRGDYAYVSRRPGLKESGGALNYVEDASHPLHEGNGINRVHPRGGALLRTAWCTPDFVLGMSQVAALPRDDWTAISSQNRWNGVIFAGHPTARIFTQPRMPAKGSVYNAEWGVQHKGVMILQRLKASNAQGQLIWFDNSLQLVENDGWVFAEARQAYAAVRIVQGGGNWVTDTIEQRRDGKGRSGIGRWLSLEDQYAPVIIEVARKQDFPDLARFRTAILDNPLSCDHKRVEYRSEFYGNALALPVNADGPPLVNGAPVDFEPRSVYASPFLQGDFGEGVVTISRGETKLELDFTENTAQ